MNIDQCIAILISKGYRVEIDTRPHHADCWLVFGPFPLTHEEIENGGVPNFFDSPKLIEWADRYFTTDK